EAGGDQLLVRGGACGLAIHGCADRPVGRLEYLHPNWDGNGLPDGVYGYLLMDKTSNTVIRRGGLTIRRNPLNNN
ncbi:MAG: hypothetical protein AAF570_11115, partial [Bacteroidota bacterium]